MSARLDRPVAHTQANLLQATPARYTSIVTRRIKGRLRQSEEAQKWREKRKMPKPQTREEAAAHRWGHADMMSLLA